MRQREAQQDLNKLLLTQDPQVPWPRPVAFRATNTTVQQYQCRQLFPLILGMLLSAVINVQHVQHVQNSTSILAMSYIATEVSYEYS